MPSRNVRKIDVEETYYHVYARGASKQVIFLDAQDYDYFLKLFTRYLSILPQRDKTGLAYPHYRGRIELLAYCLMPNHFHLLVYQHHREAMSKLMQSVMTSYARYFNLRHKRSGSIYESTYKASMIATDSYLQHVSRYIHLNPRRWRRYLYSSVELYLSSNKPEWCQPQRVLNLFTNTQSYKEFLLDYDEYKRTRSEIDQQIGIC